MARPLHHSEYVCHFSLAALLSFPGEQTAAGGERSERDFDGKHEAIIGHSLGGMIGLEIALRRPKRIGCLAR